MSLFAEYVLERTDDLIIETSGCFAVYRYLPGGKGVYIMDIYVQEHLRQCGAAADLADRIVIQAKEKGCIEIFGTVVPSLKGATRSVKVLLAYGMSVHKASEDLITFRKDI